MTVFIGTVPS